MSTSSPSGIPPWQRRFLEREGLPPAYLETAERFFDPLAAALAEQRTQRGRPLRVAINGSQGSGKSTLGAYLAAILPESFGLSTVVLSLDDFYLTRRERQALAARVHPLLATRGVPGTHDVPLMESTLRQLGDVARRGEEVALPSFDKSVDDRRPQDEWSHHSCPQDVVILEGWCLGARHESEARLAEPVNDLERLEDPDGRWRRFINDALANSYEPLYGLFDFWVMLAAPSFAQVLGWRSEQEAKLRARVGGRGEGLMDDAALRRFVAHYERQTRQCLRDLPAAVDVLYRLDADRGILDCRGLDL